MFRKLLVCTDLSPASDALIRCVEELKQGGLEEVILTHVAFAVSAPGVEDICAAEKFPALSRQKEYLEERDIQVTLEVPCGMPAECIVRAADEHDVSGIMIGSHGKGILEAATLGSVSTQVLRLAHCPVLLARITLLGEDTCESVCSRLFARILCPSDFSETAEKALEYLGNIVRDTGSSVTILHVREQQASLQAEEDVRFLLDSKIRRLKERSTAAVTGEIVSGEPAMEIARWAKDGGFSLIVMGSRGKGVVKELFLGSVANEISRTAETPVLFIPVQR